MGKKIILLIIGLVVIVGLIIGILAIVNRGSNEPTVTTLKIWSPFDEKKIYDQISADYLKTNPNVVLDFQYVKSIDAKDYEAKVVNAIANNVGPDIWLARNDWIPKHAPKSETINSTITIKKKKVDTIAYLKESMPEAVAKMSQYKDGIYGVPLSADALAVIVNSKVINDYKSTLKYDDQKNFFDSNSTWESIQGNLRTLNKVSGGKIERSSIAIGTADNTYASVDVLSSIMLQNQVKFTDDEGNVIFNLANTDLATPIYPAKNSLDLYTSFSKKGDPNYSWDSTMGDPIDAFLSGKTLALVGYYSTLQQILDKKPSFKVGVMPLPQVTDKSDPVYYGALWTHLVNKDSVKKEVAWNYLLSLANGRVVGKYAELTGKLPLSVTTISPRYGITGSDSAQSLYVAELQKAQGFQKPDWQITDKIFQDMIKQVTVYGQTSQVAVDSAAQALKSNL